MLPSDLTALVFSNLLWFLLTLCLGSVLIMRPHRSECAEVAGRAVDDVVAVSAGIVAEDPADAPAGEQSAPLPAADPPRRPDTAPSRRPRVRPVPLPRPVPAGLASRAVSIVAPVPAQSRRVAALRASGAGRHRRPRPAAAPEKLLAQAAAVAIAVIVVTGVGTGLIPR